MDELTLHLQKDESIVHLYKDKSTVHLYKDESTLNLYKDESTVQCTVYSVHLLYVLYKDGSIVNKKMFNTWSKAGPSTTPTGNNHLEFSSSLYEKKLKMFYSEYEYFLQYYQVKYL